MNKYFTTLTLVLLSPSIMAAGFNCNHANTFVEQAICRDKPLSALDSVLAAAYKKASINKNNTRLAEQRNWLKIKRNRCENKACLIDVYQARISELRKQSTKMITGKPVSGKVVNDLKTVTSKTTDEKLTISRGEATSEPRHVKSYGNQKTVLDQNIPDNDKFNAIQNLKADLHKKIDTFLEKK